MQLSPINAHKSALLSTINAFLFENIWYNRKNAILGVFICLGLIWIFQPWKLACRRKTTFSTFDFERGAKWLFSKKSKLLDENKFLILILIQWSSRVCFLKIESLRLIFRCDRISRCEGFQIVWIRGGFPKPTLRYQ